jgi:cell wall-associated NlpC family hydrolase
MNKKFAAVGVGLAIVLSFTNCTGDIADAEQLNIATSTVVQKSINFNPIESLTLMQKQQQRLQKVERNTTKMKNVLKYLKSRKHKTPYVFAGSNPKYGWDCSGLVLWTYKQFNIELKHSATAQGHSGKKVSYKNAKPGDIVTFSHGSNYWYYHSGIYLGNGMIVDGNSWHGTTVVQPITNFKGDKITFRRLVETN